MLITGEQDEQGTKEMRERELLTQLEETGKLHRGSDIWALSGVTQVLERFSVLENL